MNQLKTIGLLGVLSAILVVLGQLAAPGALWLFVAIAVVMNVVSYFFSDKIVLRMNRARELGEREDPALRRIVSELAAEAEIPVPKIFVVEDPSPNAFATGRNPAHGVVAVTTGIRRLLSDRELRGVIAHELAHIKNRDILIASIGAMIATAIAVIASVAKWGAIFGGGRDGDRNPIATIAMAIIAPIAASLVQFAISRTREYKADRTGAEISGDPLALASALTKLERGAERVPLRAAHANPASASLYICNPLAQGSVRALFSTHPPIPERVRRLRALAA